MQGVEFGMWASKLAMKPLSNHDVVSSDDASDHRIRFHPTSSTLSQFQCDTHEMLVGIFVVDAERRGHQRLSPFPEPRACCRHHLWLPVRRGFRYRASKVRFRRQLRGRPVLRARIVVNHRG